MLLAHQKLLGLGGLLCVGLSISPLIFLFTRAMASVLDGIRGKKAKEVVNIIAMPDDEYSLYLAEVQSLKPKQQKTWKRRNVKTDGSTQTVRYDGKGFYTQWLSQRVAVESVSRIAELEREQQSRGLLHAFGCQVADYRDVATYHASMDQMQIETRTGNHHPRNHPFRVPTRASEPVRA